MTAASRAGPEGRFLVGLTGGLASGKSTVAALFEALGVAVVDADVVARAVVEPGSEALAEIVAAFGDSLLDEKGALERSALRELVFADEQKRSWLEQILHPRIRAEMRSRAERASGPYVVLCIPLLLETGRQSSVDRVLVVDVPPALQMARALARDGSSPATIRGILDAQMGRDERLSRADDVIDNSGSPAALGKKIAALHQRYLDLAESLRAAGN